MSDIQMKNKGNGLLGGRDSPGWVRWSGKSFWGRCLELTSPDVREFKHQGKGQAVRQWDHMCKELHGRSRLSGFEEQKGICGQDIINKESMAWGGAEEVVKDHSTQGRLSHRIGLDLTLPLDSSAGSHCNLTWTGHSHSGLSSVPLHPSDVLVLEVF